MQCAQDAVLADQGRADPCLPRILDRPGKRGRALDAVTEVNGTALAGHQCCDRVGVRAGELDPHPLRVQPVVRQSGGRSEYLSHGAGGREGLAGVQEQPAADQFCRVGVGERRRGHRMRQIRLRQLGTIVEV
jgi:hypothetical protein